MRFRHTLKNAPKTFSSRVHALHVLKRALRTLRTLKQALPASMSDSISLSWFLRHSNKRLLLSYILVLSKVLFVYSNCLIFFHMKCWLFSCRAMRCLLWYMCRIIFLDDMYVMFVEAQLDVHWQQQLTITSKSIYRNASNKRQGAYYNFWSSRVGAY